MEEKEYNQNLPEVRWKALAIDVRKRKYTKLADRYRLICRLMREGEDKKRIKQLRKSFYIDYGFMPCEK